MAQWIRPRTLNHEVPGLNLLAAAVVPLGKALYPHCLLPRKGLKAVGPLVACFFSGQVKKNPTIYQLRYICFARKPCIKVVCLHRAVIGPMHFVYLA